MAESLRPMDLPLRGSRLIEASAGTGKTFTLALLYTRLVLGHGDEASGFGRLLTPREILVVTFTEAAAKELRDRIRARLVEAADAFSQPEHEDVDAALQELRSGYAESDWPSCAWRLQSAAEGMDEACISTIHGWCNRMLVEHAFDTGSLFDRELVTDTSELLAETLRDYWRVHFYPLDETDAECVSEAFATPQELQQALGGLLRMDSQGVSYRGSALQVASLRPHLDQWRRYHEAQAQAEAARQKLEQAARQAWDADRVRLRAHLLALRPHLNGTKHQSVREADYLQLLDEIEAWSAGGDAPNKLGNFAAGRFSFKSKAAVQQEDDLPAFAALRRWTEVGEASIEEPEPALKAAILAHARVWVGEQFAQRMSHQAQMGFDDLLSQLQRALDPERSGDRAEHLAGVLRRAFPVALIDEFQDTDPVQYRIFDHIYRVGQADTGSTLLLIGDPKQAIYSFRGADIHTYLAARQATRGNHYSLGRNFRSSEGLVRACNHLFSAAEQFDRGAFRFSQDGDNPLPYRDVAAQGTEQTFCREGGKVAPMTLWYLPAEEGKGALNLGDYRARAAQHAASQVVDWLRAARQGQAGFGQAGNVDRPLRPGDIAILVRKGDEAMAVRRELDARGVSSVYLSDRESLFTSQEAADMVHWLKACAEPGSERLVRKALASNSLALPLDQLIAWQEAELAWEAQMQRFAAFQQVWRQQGVLVMLYRLLDDFALPTRLQGEGERSLTNLLHLAEWLQQAEGQLDGEQALIRHLSDHLGLKDEQQLLRLESDEARVQVITIHKSKGLEYPLVLLPFIGGWKKVNGKIREVTWRHEGGRYQEVSGKSRFADAWERADDERLSEDLRLLYVALTRARFAVWLGLGPLVSGNGSKPELHESAIGYLLTGGARFDSAEQVHAALKGWTEACDAIQLEEVGTASDRRLPPSAVQSLEPARPAPDLQNLDDWWIASYSAIRYQGKGEQGDGTPPLVLPEASTEAPPSHRDQAPECAADATAEEHLDEPALEPVEAEGVMHQLPAGSLWGTFLHSLLEWAAGHRYHSAEGITYRGFAAAVADDAARNALLQRRCRQRGIEPLADDLSDWLQGFLRQPWSLPPDPAGSLCAPLVLADLTPEQLAVELEFLLSSNHFDSETLDRWVCAHMLQGAGRPAALPNRFNGLFKGFIDLVVVHEGRYFVIDWKSNQLGPNDRAYTPEAMREAILHKRYDLQYVLYLLALHRQLRARLPDYDYDRHIGGAIYVFLRGSASPSQGLFHDRPPRQLIEALDRGFRGQLPAGEVL